MTSLTSGVKLGLMKKIKVSENTKLFIAIVNVVIIVAIVFNIPDSFFLHYELWSCPGSTMCNIPIIKKLR